MLSHGGDGDSLFFLVPDAVVALGFLLRNFFIYFCSYSLFLSTLIACDICSSCCCFGGGVVISYLFLIDHSSPLGCTSVTLLEDYSTL